MEQRREVLGLPLPRIALRRDDRRGAQWPGERTVVAVRPGCRGRTGRAMSRDAGTDVVRVAARVAASRPIAKAAYADHRPTAPILCSKPGLRRRGTTW